MGIGVCVLAAPEIVVGAVIVAGVVVVGFAIKEALDAYELKWADQEDARPMPEAKPAPQVPSPGKRPRPEPKGPDFPPVGPIETSERERRPECKPRRVKHRGGNTLHNTCADRIPYNTFAGWDALVNGKNFDALQMRTRTLWEVKTNDIEAYNPFVQRIELDKQIEEARRERALAAACRFDFRIGVRSEAHKEALEDAAPEFRGLIEVMDWC